MNYRLIFPCAAALLLAACGADDDNSTTETMAANTAPADAALGGGAPASVAASDTAGMPSTPAAFVTTMAASDAFELEISRMAGRMARNASIKSFAAMMVEDHTKSSSDLAQAAAASNPPVPITPALTPAQQAKVDALLAAGADFDRLFVETQVTAHQEVLANLQHYGANGDAGPLRDLARRLAPVINQHLTKAKSLPQ